MDVLSLARGRGTRADRLTVDGRRPTYCANEKLGGHICTSDGVCAAVTGLSDPRLSASLHVFARLPRDRAPGTPTQCYRNGQHAYLFVVCSRSPAKQSVNILKSEK